MKNQTVLVVDFGGQYNQLIVRRVRNLGVYAELVPNTITIEKIKSYDPIGIIFTGGPHSVYKEDSPKVDKEIFNLGVPIFGICYGMQLMSYMNGGSVVRCDIAEYGTKKIRYSDSVIFEGMDKESVCWMSHGDQVASVPEGYIVTASTDECKIAAYEYPAKKFYAVQAHPEVVHTINGNVILKNFLYKVCGAKGDWTMGDYAAEQLALFHCRKQESDGIGLLGKVN